MATRATVAQNNTTYVTATYFSLFLGFVGVDRFYMGYVWLGILKLISFGGLGIWWLIDLIWIALGNAKTKSGVRIPRKEADMRLVYIGVGIFLLMQVVGAIVGTITYESTLRSFDNSVTELTKTLDGAVIEATGEGNDKKGEGTVKITLPKSD